MRFISWNVNGLRAVVGKGFMDYFNSADADIFSVQETKLQEGQIDLKTEGYYQYWNYAEKKGYSGTAVFTKIKPLYSTDRFRPTKSGASFRIRRFFIVFSLNYSLSNTLICSLA